MMRALYTAATGMIAEQTNVDTIANNLANVNTTGYKTERTEFKSLLYQTIQTKTTTANGDQKPVGAQAGLGTRVAATASLYTQGAFQETGNSSDFAIDGDGFFAVRATDGNIYFTRNGNFTWSLDANGNTILTTNDGYPVLDTTGNVIQVPEGVQSEQLVFSTDGSIAYVTPEGRSVSMNQNVALYQFNNPSGLEKMANSLLAQTGASGEAMLEQTNTGLKPSEVHQGYSEMSNVSVADEMVNMIIAQRAYELNSKAITTSDSMLETANNLKR
jgi:flagellar basal-body rod protein FlgG